jgi:hypothetical protein
MQHTTDSEHEGPAPTFRIPQSDLFQLVHRCEAWADKLESHDDRSEKTCCTHHARYPVEVLLLEGHAGRTKSLDIGTEYARRFSKALIAVVSTESSELTLPIFAIYHNMNRKHLESASFPYISLGPGEPSSPPRKDPLSLSVTSKASTQENKKKQKHPLT